MKYFVLAVCIGSALARPDGAGHHHHEHAAAAAAAPSAGYVDPASAGGYAAPADAYSSGGYEQPAEYAPTGYDNSAGYDTGYVEPAYQSNYAVAAPAPGFDVRWLIIPCIIVAGLFLLFPSITTVTVRRKRSGEEEVSENSLVSRVQDIYMSVLQSEECMERVACEMGGLVADAGISKNIFSAAEMLVPSKYSKMMKRFNNAKECNKIKCGSF